MQSSNLSFWFDWIVATIRWVTLFGLTISLASSERLSLPIVLILLGGALWNACLNTLAALNRRLVAHRQVSIIVDTAVAYLLFYLSGSSNTPIGWAGILPIVSASMYFEYRGAILITILSLVVQGFLAWQTEPLTSVLILIGTLIPLYLGVGFLFSYFNRRFSSRIQATQKALLANRKEKERLELERRRSIYNLISALSASLNYQRVLDTALDLGASALSAPNGQADKVVSVVLLFQPSEANGTQLHVGSARRFTPSDLRIALPGRNGLIGRSIDDGEPHLTKELAKDAELGRFVALRACKSAYCIPLRTGLDTYGVLLFAHPESEFFTPDQRELLDIIGKQSVIAIQNARLYQDLELEKERMMEIQEEARKKMARDLHDGPTQSVAAIAMRVNFARRLMDRDSKAAADELYKIEDLARRTTKEIRHMLFTLRPLVLESQGLIAALESMAEKMRETYNQNVIIDADPHIVDELEMGKQAVAFYIAEEAVNNARKHAKAEHIWVRLRPLQIDLCLLEVEDDGAGFNISAVDASYENRGSLGMVNMRERTELVNGILQLESEEGRGTRIRVLIPLSEEAADRVRRGL